MQRIKRTILGTMAASLWLCGVCSPLLAKAPRVSPLEQTNWKKVSPKKTELESFSPQIGHSRRISSISFDAGGKLMATASGFDDGMIKVWDMKAKRIVRTLDGEDWAALSPDGRFIASGNVGGPIKIWQVAGWELVKTLQGSGPIMFTTDGKHLVGEALPDKMGGEGRLMRWEVEGWKPTAALEGHSASFTTMARAAGGRFMATGGYDESIKVWDVTLGQIVRTMKTGQVKAPAAIALSSDGEWMAVSYREGAPAVQIWDVSEAKVVRTLELPKFATQLAYSPDDNTLAVAALDDKTYLFDPNSGKQTGKHEGAGQVAYVPVTGQLVHGEQELTLRQADGSIAHTFPANTSLVFQTVFARDGKTLVTTDARSSVDVWEVASGKLLRTTPIENGSMDSPLGELILSPDGTYVARRPFVGSALMIWKVADGSVAHDLRFDDFPALRGVTFAPNEKELVLESPSGEDGTQVVWWNLEEGKILNSTKLAGYVSVSGFVDDGKNVALVSTGTNTGKARLAMKLWERDSGLMESIKVDGIPPFAGDIDFAGRGGLIALGDVDNTVKLWDRKQKKLTLTFTKHTNLVNLVEFSPDGRLLATGGWDEAVHIWNVETGAQVMQLTGGLYQAQHIAFSPRDEVMAISHKGWLKLIHLPTGRMRTLYRQGDGWLAIDSAGHFECEGKGCERATYHTVDGEFIESSDARIKSLRGLQPFGK